MYCSDCGTVNPDRATFCLKCGRDLTRPKKQEVSDIDAALAARPAAIRQSTGTSTGLLIGLVVLIAAAAGAVIFISVLSLQMKKSRPILTRDKPAVDQSEGFGMATDEAPGAIARDAGKKVNSSKARMALEQYFAQNDRYPETLADLDQNSLGFVADPAIYRYQPADGGRNFRLEIQMESNRVSGADVIKEGGTTKLVITADN